MTSAPFVCMCVDAFTGVLSRVKLEVPADGRATGKDLREALQKRQKNPSGQPINIIHGGTGDTLREVDALDEKVEHFVFVDAGSRGIPTTLAAEEDPSRRLERQIRAFTMLGMPVSRYLNRCETEKKNLGELLETVSRDNQAARAELPNILDGLGGIKQLETQKSLAAALEPDRPFLVAEESIKAAKEVLGSVEAAFQNCVVKAGEVVSEPVPTPASGDEHAHSDMADRLLRRMRNVKDVLRSVDEIRRNIQKTHHTILVVRRHVEREMRGLQSLPESYPAAVQLAQRRVTLHRASHRVMQSLQIEVDEVNRIVEDLRAKWGRVFPSSLLPSLLVPCAAGAPSADPFARAFAPHFPELDEDLTSALLVRVGLAPQSAKPDDGQELQEQCHKLREEIDSKARQLAELRDAYATLESQLASVGKDCKNYEDFCSTLSVKLQQATAEVQKSHDKCECLEAANVVLEQELKKERGGHEAVASPVGHVVEFRVLQRGNYVAFFPPASTLMLSSECAVKLGRQLPPGATFKAEIIRAVPVPGMSPSFLLCDASN